MEEGKNFLVRKTKRRENEEDGEGYLASLLFIIITLQNQSLSAAFGTESPSGEYAYAQKGRAAVWQRSLDHCYINICTLPYLTFMA